QRQAAIHFDLPLQHLGRTGRTGPAGTGIRRIVARIDELLEDRFPGHQLQADLLAVEPGHQLRLDAFDRPALVVDGDGAGKILRVQSRLWYALRLAVLYA